MSTSVVWKLYLFEYVLFVICVGRLCSMFCFLFKQKTAYEMRISDWSSDVCSSDLLVSPHAPAANKRCAPELRSNTITLEQAQGTIRRRWSSAFPEIGRASCRERVCQYG